MTIKARGELLEPTDQVNLIVQFKDTSGNPIDTDSFPSLTVIQPSGLVAFGPTSAGVSKISTGKYSYQLMVPFNGPFGVWNDVWIGLINGFRVESTFSFVVSFTDMPMIDSDGYVQLGNDPGFNYSQTAIKNINKLLKTLKARLNSSGKSKSKDAYGNVVYVDCDIFSVDMLTTFLANALTDFNQVPFFTRFNFEESDFVDQFHDILVEGATLSCLASQALIERGRSFNISDNGVTFTPPDVSEMLNTQYNTLLTQYYEKLKYIKNSLRPYPKSLGTLRPLAASPAFLRMRHKRAGRLF